MPEFNAIRLRIPLTPPQVAPSTSAVLWEPAVDTGRVGVVIAHGAGTDMTNQVVCGVGRGLASHGYPTLAFNFSYTEAGRKRPDPPGRLEQAYRDVLARGAEVMGGRPLVIGGRSMGGRIASRLAAQGQDCAGLLLLGYPLHPRIKAGERSKPIPRERLRTAHWRHLTVPSLFIQGDRDNLCRLSTLERELRTEMQQASARVHVVAGADHGYGVRKADGRSPAEVLDEVVQVAGAWLDRLTGRVEGRSLVS